MNLETYISEFSKYVIALIMALYTLVSFVGVTFKSEKKLHGVFVTQNILMFAFHFSSFMVICFETNDVSCLVFYAFQQIVLYAAVMLYKAFYPKSNRLIINNMCMMLSVSFVILTRLDYSKSIKQFGIVTVSLVAGLFIPLLIRKVKIIRNLKWIYCSVGILLLGIMMILGQTTYGSKISYSIAGISFQPAEFVKILFVFFVAGFLYKAEGFIDVFTATLFAAIHVGIQVINKDLGSALIFFIVYICMLFIATNNYIYMILGLACGAAASYVAYDAFRHIQVRVQAFLDPWSVIDSAGYQITQSLFAISSGGWVGLGLYNGTPSSIPFVEADFIFSALTEEFGIIFGICIILICVSSFIAFMKVSFRLEDRFYQLVSFGFAISYIFQIFLTIGGGTKFIPLTGVTLPLISYGGTSVLCTVIIFSIIEGIYLIQVDEENTEIVHKTVKSGKTAKADKSVRPAKNVKQIKNTKASKERPEKRKRKVYYQQSEYENDDYEEYDDEYYDEKYDDEYGNDEYGNDEYEDSEYVNEEYSKEDDDLEFIHGYTVNIDQEELGKIYYNEEEYEKDKRSAESKKKNQTTDSCS